MKLKIRVANPVSGNLTWISYKSATRYVASGRASWQKDGSIRFDENHHAHRSAEQSVLAARTGYDRINTTMRVDQLLGLPMIGDPVKLLTVRRRR